VALPVLTVSLAGHLTKQSLEGAFVGVREQLARGDEKRVVLFDCTAMDDYDFEAREAFVVWHRQHRTRLARVAIATDRAIWHLVVRTMALASSTPMRPFATVPDATAWLTSAI